MATREDVFRFLSGGIGALIPSGGDGEQVLQGTAASPAERPEETKPEPTLIQTESFLSQATAPRILIGTVALVAIISLFAFARR